MPFIFCNVVGYLVTCSGAFELLFYNILNCDCSGLNKINEEVHINFIDQKNHHLLQLEYVSVIKLTAYISFMLNMSFIAFDVFMLFVLNFI